MRDELFDHLKHKLAETEIPDPGQGWQLMSSLLDAATPPKQVRVLYRWYAAAACLLVAGAAWAIIHEIRTGNPTLPAVAHSSVVAPSVATPAVTPSVGAPAPATGAPEASRTVPAIRPENWARRSGEISSRRAKASVREVI